jgi:hypothetical protein
MPTVLTQKNLIPALQLLPSMTRGDPSSTPDTRSSTKPSVKSFAVLNVETDY